MNLYPRRLKSTIAMLVFLGAIGGQTAQGAPGAGRATLTGQSAAAGAGVVAAGQPVTLWQPTGRPQAIAVVVHGITANAQCLRTVGNALAADGVLAYGVDLRGHGWWYSRRHPCTAESGQKCDYQASVQDVDALLAKLRARHPGLPIFLIGESVGAAVVLRAAADSSSLVDGVVLCAAGTKCAHANPLWLFGDVCKACIGHSIDLTRYQRKYGTEDPIALKELQHEKNLRTVYSARELLSTIRFIRKNGKFAGSLPAHLPILVLQGADDRAVQPSSCRKLFTELSSQNKRYVSIPNCGHVLLATPRVKRVVTDSILGFINQQTAKSTLAAQHNMFE